MRHTLHIIPTGTSAITGDEEPINNIVWKGRKRMDIPINSGWKFHLGDENEAFYKGFDDSGWETVELPHDWSVSLPFDIRYSSGTGYLAGGTG